MASKVINRTDRRGNEGKGRTQTRAVGRFLSTYTDTSLYEVVRVVAETLLPDTPLELRQTQFDKNRAPLGFADAPSARQIATRLKKKWRDVVADAVEEKPKQTLIDSSKRTFEEADWLLDRHIVYALRFITAHLKQDTLTQFDDELGRAKLIDLDRKRHRYGRRRGEPADRQSGRHLRREDR